eukprot:TRINITY_DN147_c0_g1_i4.p1 TRINITY_DN147_c0_g1~~TRINITY_DN147_c0_g1_i4.p1  ORF type:complete len:347 (+),score=147.59 TRINITY_DN147_c0_g1_i4:32-1042(+)
MSRTDSSDPAIAAAIETLKSTPGNNWVLLGYVPKSDTKLKVEETGEGGVNEVKEYFNDGKVQYALVAFTINNMRKLVYLSWCGDGVTGMKKGLFNNHVNDVGLLFKGYHIQVNARNEDDINENDIKGKLTKATGASYDSGQKQQGKASHVPTNVAAGKAVAQQSSIKLNQADKSDYDKKGDSQSFWAQQRAQEEQDKQNEASERDRKRKEAEAEKLKERDEYNRRQREESAAAAAAPAPSRPTVAAGNSGALKNRFENPPAAQPPARAAPPPKSAPAPPKPAFKAPEPEPEPAYEEQSYDQNQGYEEQSYDQSGYDQNQGYEEQSYDQNQGYEEQS